MTIGSASGKPHFLYLDCVRGYAILMVIATHLTAEFHDLPYPARRLAMSGWFGVQLFFLASAVTLLMSWHSEAARGPVDVRAFFIRRFFRIAPAYYAAGVLYFFISPPVRFSLPQVLRTATFINGFYPAWLTLPSTWIVVPGGWSISVEFTFYLLFPIYATLVTSIYRAVAVLAISVVAGAVANLVALGWLWPNGPDKELGNFLFFWFPNQASVFALGGVLFFMLRAAQNGTGPGRLLLGRGSSVLAVVSIGAFCALAYLPLGHFLGDRPMLPAGQIASLALAGLILALSVNRSLLVNPAIAAMGRVSFSAYLLHFALLRVFHIFPETLHVRSTGLNALAAYAAGFVLVSAMTFAASLVSYRVIEIPMIRAGGWLIRRMKPLAPRPDTMLATAAPPAALATGDR